MSFKDFVYMVFALTVSMTIFSIVAIATVVGLEESALDWAFEPVKIHFGVVFGCAAFYYSFKLLKNKVLGFKFVSEKPRQS